MIILFIKFDQDFFSALFRYASVLMFPVIFFLLYTLIFDLNQPSWLEQFELINLFNVASGFLLLTSHLTKRKYVSKIVILYYILFVVLSLIYGRRGGVISCVLLLMFMIYVRLRSPLFNIRHRTKMYLAGILIVMFVLSFGYLLKSTYAFERFQQEGFQESRAVFTDFFEDFTSRKTGSSDVEYRAGFIGPSILRDLDIIEQGFLTVILRALLYLVPFVLIFLRAAGSFFRNNNDLVKALAILVLHLALMFYLTCLIIRRLCFLWISITACFNKRMRIIRMPIYTRR